MRHLRQILSTAASQLLNVIELEEPPRLAAEPGFAHERAPVLVALPHGALHVRRDVARIGARAVVGGARPGGLGELALLELAHEQP